MTTTTTGNFVWYDLLTTDPQAALGFYEHVIGWTTRPMGDTGYTMFVSDQGPLAGAVALPDSAKAMGAPAHWTSNVGVANVDETVAEAKTLGATIYHGPADYPDVGRLAVMGDPFGATMNVFTPSRPITAHDATKPGEFVWHELLASDHDAAFAFYSKIFGWKKSSEFDMGAMGKYLLYNNGGSDLGGMFTKPKDMPVSAWMFYVRVSDLDAATDRAKSRGGRVLNGPMDVPGGARIVQLADPQGAMFSLHALKQA